MVQQPGKNDSITCIKKHFCDKYQTQELVTISHDLFTQDGLFLTSLSSPIPSKAVYIPGTYFHQKLLSIIIISPIFTNCNITAGKWPNILISCDIPWNSCHLKSQSDKKKCTFYLTWSDRTVAKSELFACFDYE